jgi:RNA polymerase sigma-70 factor (ECF subfamily)
LRATLNSSARVGFLSNFAPCRHMQVEVLRGSIMIDQANVTDFIKLLTAYEVRLRAFALSIVPHWADAEEVLQEAHLVMWRKFGQFEPGTNFFAWGCRIIHLTAKDFRKRQSRGKVLFGDEFMELIKEQTVQMETRLAEREQLLNECVSHLKERQRRMLHLR